MPIALAIRERLESDTVQTLKSLDNGFDLLESVKKNAKRQIHSPMTAQQNLP